MIGSIIRQRHEEWTRKHLTRLLRRPFFASEISYTQVEKIVKVMIQINTFLMNITFFFALIYIFVKGSYNSIGFEKTVIVLMVIMLFLTRRFMERMGSKGEIQ